MKLDVLTSTDLAFQPAVYGVQAAGWAPLPVVRVVVTTLLVAVAPAPVPRGQ